LFNSTVIGATFDSIDVIARSALLSSLNEGVAKPTEHGGVHNGSPLPASMASPSECAFVCSVMFECFESVIAGPTLN